MPLVKVIRHGQVTIPKELRDVLGIKEGDVLEAEIVGNIIVFKPKTLIDKTSTLSPQGEKKVAEALRAYEKGKSKRFNEVEDLIQELNS